MDSKDLENALNDVGSAGSSEVEAEAEAKMPEMSKEEEIGFHKGAVSTLAAERNELVKIVGNVEAILSAHLKRLKEMGVEIGNK